MSILINEVPANQISPGIFGQIDPTAKSVGASQIPYKFLALGQKTSAGTAEALTVLQVTSAKDAETKFGAGSHLHNMAEVYFNTTPAYPMYAIAMADDGSGVASTGTVTFSGTATASGTYKLYLGGVDSKRMISVGVTVGDTAADVADAVAASINANTSLSVTAAAVTGVVTITAKNKGTTGDTLQIFENFYDDDSTPAGLSTVVVAMSGGATDPDVQDALDAIPEDDWYQFITGVYAPEKIENYLASRFVATYAKSGMYINCENADVLSTLTAFGATRNSAHSCYIGTINNPCLFYDISTAVIAKALPLIANRQTYNLANVICDFVVSSKKEYVLNNSERNQLLANGISTQTSTVDGKFQINKLITTYQLNDAGAPDQQFRDIQSFFAMQYIRYDLVVFLATVYQNYNLADDGSKYGLSASKVTTPNAIAASVQNRCILWGENAIIENTESAIESVIAERNGNNRVDLSLEVDLMGRAEVIAAIIGFQP